MGKVTLPREWLAPCHLSIAQTCQVGPGQLPLNDQNAKKGITFTQSEQTISRPQIGPGPNKPLWPGPIFLGSVFFPTGKTKTERKVSLYCEKYNCLSNSPCIFFFDGGLNSLKKGQFDRPLREVEMTYFYRDCALTSHALHPQPKLKLYHVPLTLYPVPCTLCTGPKGAEGDPLPGGVNNLQNPCGTSPAQAHPQLSQPSGLTLTRAQHLIPTLNTKLPRQ